MIRSTRFGARNIWAQSLFCLLSAADRMCDARQRIGAVDEWYLYFPAGEEEPPQPYRTAPTVWPLSADELSRTERASQSSDKAERAAALNNLGT